jgi:hypothetical protein
MGIVTYVLVIVVGLPFISGSLLDGRGSEL